ncbi:MAG: NAD(P)H-hydrate epimerase [Haloglomus sp.]
MSSGAEFTTPDGRRVPAVTADEMREVDRVATDEVGVGLLQMMEHAGRNLAREALAMTEEAGGSDGPIVVAAGDGGNGGGGLCAARHLLNRSQDVRIVLDRPADELHGAAAEQWSVLEAMGVTAVTPGGDEPSAITVANADADLVIDALVGYGLSGALRGTAADLVAGFGEHRVLSLDVPSGVDATTGEAPKTTTDETPKTTTDETPGVAAAPARTLTLALPKTGLAACGSDLVLADIGLPRVVFERAGVEYPEPGPFAGTAAEQGRETDDGYRVPLTVDRAE